METTISLTGETLDFALKVYRDKESAITKQLKSVDMRMKKLSKTKETLEQELSGVKSFVPSFVSSQTMAKRLCEDTNDGETPFKII